jgi:hypothetical protein
MFFIEGFLDKLSGTGSLSCNIVAVWLLYLDVAPTYYGPAVKCHVWKKCDRRKNPTTHFVLT